MHPRARRQSAWDFSSRESSATRWSIRIAAGIPHGSQSLTRNGRRFARLSTYGSILTILTPPGANGEHWLQFANHLSFARTIAKQHGRIAAARGAYATLVLPPAGLR